MNYLIKHSENVLDELILFEKMLQLYDVWKMFQKISHKKIKLRINICNCFEKSCLQF